MAGLKELPFGAQILIAVLVAALVAGGGWYLLVTPMQTTNQQNQAALKKILDDNANLQKYANDLPGVERQIAALQQQLEIQKTIVPDKREVPNFMHLMQDTATSAGIQIRSYSSQSPITKQYYTEVPYAMELDGPYYSMVNFFDKVSKLQRIINVNGLELKGLNAKGGGGTYQYSPTESVTAKCTTTTFFSHDAAEAPPAKNARPAPKGRK